MIGRSIKKLGGLVSVRRLDGTKPDGPVIVGNTLPDDMHAVSIGIDTSPSTLAAGAKKVIGEGTKKLVDTVGGHPLLSRQVELAVYGFGQSTPVKCYQSFTAVSRFEFRGVPDVSWTMLYSLYAQMVDDTLVHVNRLGSAHDCEVRASWIFIFSDFQAHDDEARDRALAAKEKATERGVNVFLMGCGEAVDMKTAEELSQRGRPVVMMNSAVDFLEFFAWLAKSIRMKSQSIGGQRLRLPNLLGQDLEADG